MRVELAGYNTDAQYGGGSPETLSAAYARISRDPRPIGELRRESASEIAGARASNRRIVFDYGHGSVAEHAVFNFDILDVSRLAAEALQSFRLASFTEKSQRYIRMKGDLVVPEELDPEQAGTLRRTADTLFRVYSALHDGLSGAGAAGETAREDARYVLPMASTCQMGMTVNARELELMSRRLAIHPLAEVRTLTSALLGEAMKVAPSLFLFIEPTSMDSFAHSMSPLTGDQQEVTLTDCDDDGRIGALLIQRMEGLPLDRARERWDRMGGEDRKKLFLDALDGLGIHDPVPRQWEFFHAEFEAVMSASAFAQMKRHRMCCRLTSVYDPSLGVTVPPSIASRPRLRELFDEAMAVSTEAAGTLGTLYPYLLTNAHRRRVTVSMDGRELYHFSRLREDSHAQWDIRHIAGMVMDSVREAAPLTMMLTGGKSEMETEGE